MCQLSRSKLEVTPMLAQEPLGSCRMRARIQFRDPTGICGELGSQRFSVVRNTVVNDACVECGPSAARACVGLRTLIYHARASLRLRFR
jgi:hypothetical protein